MLRQRLQKSVPLRNIFQVHPAPWVTEWLGPAGFESITFDLQHGTIENSDLLALAQAARAGGSHTLARLAWNRPEAVMKVLDCGIEAVICPMIESAADAAALVRAAKYAPLGIRSFGPFRAADLSKEDYFSTANGTALCFAMVETAGAVEELDAIAATPGLDGLYIGPFDLSVSLGLEKRADFSDPQLLDVIDRVIEAARKNDLFVGVFTLHPEDAELMIRKGVDLVSHSTEDWIFKGAIRELTQKVEGLRPEEG